MIALNLPSFQYNVKNIDGKVMIFDIIRKKYVQLTPEEWVRQHFVHFMIHHLKYPKSLISIETGLRFNQLQKRSDIIVHDRKGVPWLIVECKSPDQPINERTVWQVSVYNNTVNAPYVAMTNGIKHICYLRDLSCEKVILMDTFPSYGEPVQ